MTQAARYRTGTDRSTGQLISGLAHLNQSLADIWTTRLDERVMLLGYGSELRSWLAEDLTPATALGIYADLIVAAHTWEPEYRIHALQFVHASRLGALGLRHSGTYYPEGRLGNYTIAIPVGIGAPVILTPKLVRALA